jgi:diguanylate cyclase (GGDEF)-like protein
LLVLAVVAITSIRNLCFLAAAQTAFVFGMATPLMIYGVKHPWGDSGLLALGAFVLCVMVHFYGRAAHRLVVDDICHRLVSEMMATERRRTNADLTLAMDKIRVMAAHDPLTQCLNRRAAMTHLESERARADRHGERFGVILLDMDHFKSINDTHGHGLGDAVLVAMADRLRAHLRPSDRLARWGVEEFLCVTAHVDATALLAKAEDLRASLAEAPLVQDPKALTVTASIGVAMFTPGLTIDETIDRAERALYQAKHGGRNRVCVLP